jgi:ComF family protein
MDPPFFVARAVGPYEGCFKKAIGLLKFVGRRTVARRMGEMMADVVSGEPAFWPIDLIIPVPISAGSLAQRGFNQSQILGDHIARCLGRPIRGDILKRIKETPSQRELSRAEREENLRTAFGVVPGHRLDNKNVLLVDDVYTTGSTTRECTKALLEAGAQRVAVITWAAGRGY